MGVSFDLRKIGSCMNCGADAEYQLRTWRLLFRTHKYMCKKCAMKAVRELEIMDGRW